MEEKTFLVRINFKNNDKMINYCYDNNCIAILVDQADEIEIWQQYIDNQKRTIKKQFIDRWMTLQECVSNEDVLVLVTYRTKPSQAKIGKLTKGTEYFDYEGNSDFKLFKFEKVFEFDLKEYPIFSSIIPSFVTLSPIKKRSSIIRYLFYDQNLKNLPIELNNLSEKSVELICLEWLRSPLSKEFQIKYQLLLYGGNYPNIDILGISINNKRITAQVTTTDNQSTIRTKKKKLNNVKSDIKIIFSDSENFGNDNNDNNISEISLNQVWNDLMKNGYEELLESLVRE